MPSTPISQNTAATFNIVAAPASPAFIRVLNYLLVAGGTVTVTWNDSIAGQLSGPIPLSATCGEVEVTDDEGVFDCKPGAALQLVLGQAIQVSGHVKYRIVNG